MKISELQNRELQGPNVFEYTYLIGLYKFLSTHFRAASGSPLLEEGFKEERGILGGKLN